MNSEQKTPSLIYSNDLFPADKPAVTKNAFSTFFNKKLKDFYRITGEKIKKREIGEKLGIDSETFRKYVNKEKTVKKRDCIIAICAMLLADAEETKYAIELYGGLPPLDENDYRDLLLMNILDAQSENLWSIEKINQELKAEHYHELDIMDHRKKKPSDRMIYPYTFVKERVECWTDDLLLPDRFDSLETNYYRMCYTSAFMWLNDNGKHKYKLYAGLKENTPLFGYTMDGKEIKSFANIDDTGIFKDCFNELLQMARFEQRKYSAFLNDTRNYQERVSAKVINNELHIFYETYNFRVPELGEYYLMDYVNGVYTLYVSHCSQFMMYYLSPNDYRNLFGRISDKPKEIYSSIDAIEKVVELAQMGRKEILHLRIMAYNNSKDKIDSLIEQLKTGRAHIRNSDMIFETPYDVIEYYKVTDEFQCTYDEECGKIYNIGVDKAVVGLKDGGRVELSFDNLCDGFRLGLSSTDEIYDFLSKHGTLKISDIINNGTI